MAAASRWPRPSRPCTGSLMSPACWPGLRFTTPSMKPSPASVRSDRAPIPLLPAGAGSTLAGVTAHRSRHGLRSGLHAPLEDRGD